MEWDIHVKCIFSRNIDLPLMALPVYSICAFHSIFEFFITFVCIKTLTWYGEYQFLKQRTDKVPPKQERKKIEASFTKKYSPQSFVIVEY